MLKLTQISLLRDGKTVLDSISASAPLGQLTSLLGLNAAGKSSLLAVAAGELSPSGGEVLFDGLNVSQVPTEQLARRRAMLPQSSTLHFDFSARDIALLGAAPFPEIASNQLPGLINSVLRLCSVYDLADCPYPQLSAGEQRRTQLARVLVQACAAAAQGPAFLLLDEPTACLDPYHQHVLLAGLQQLVRTLPLSVVASLQDVNLALKYSDHAWLLRQGRLVASGPSCETLLPTQLNRVFPLHIRSTADALLFSLPGS
ncbi:ATP-binding cassette domain-containing protein [Chitinimonas sp. BJB300]|uniref:ATP-binding cassette domain-containing protein n=1 Tax=Chitinimonas sp. BJB300 TaxID=1559339 RepID=UPI000C0F8A62|nr:ATP-binding cassette domain-containing protein [Chitinimonas sp. BJB300]PHV09927.1 hemin ABC transporter ATP-binding protein [Chitinimonas sp. BJB300]TSJ89669.1 ATP-binding cassette domain-containing protein [Chitinimonas sp. BJB300]